MSFVLLCMCGPAWSQVVCTWVADGAGNWSDPANWSDAHLPVAGDTVVIDRAGARVSLGAAAPAAGRFASVTLGSAAALSFTGWETALAADAITLASGAVVSHAGCATNVVPSNTNRVWLVCSNLTIDAGGAIDVSGCGYTNVNLAVTGWGQGPGGGYACAGAGHGGVGGTPSYGNTIPGYNHYIPGRTCGSAAEPELPGSAGGSLTYSESRGGSGGGVVRIEAGGAVVVNGTIAANGLNSHSSYGIGLAGAGAGGSVWITCGTIAGSGAISAEGGRGGGNHSGSSGGGGGRIAVHYNPGSQGAAAIPKLVFSAAGNANTGDENSGDVGTLYFPDDRLLTEFLPHSGQWARPGLTEWAVSRLTISNGWIRFPRDTFLLTVTNDLTIIGKTGSRYGRLDLSTGAVCRVGGDLILTNAAKFRVQAGPANGVGVDYGALVAVTGDVDIAAGSWIYPVCEPYAGTAPLFTFDGLTVAAGSGFNADGRGYIRAGNDNGYGPLGYGYGYGPGAGYARSGAGHGGSGGIDNDSGRFGNTCGVADEQLLPGSSGGSILYSHVGGSGGGVVRLAARGDIFLDGTLSANGAAGSQSSGGGAGGSVFVACRTIRGGGTVSVNGGKGGTDGSGGGGGRIAVHYDAGAQAALPQPAIRWLATAGERGATIRHDGRMGTLYFPDNRFLSNVVQHAGWWMVTNFTAWATPSLAITNGGSIGFPHEGFVLTVDQGIAVSGTSPWLHRLELTNGAVACGGDLTLATAGLVFTAGAAPGPRLACGGDMLLRSATPAASGAAFWVHAAPVDDEDGHGARIEVAGGVSVQSNSWVYPVSHLTNGGSALFRVRDLTLETGGGINADTRGFMASPTINGRYGPEAGTSRSGGGHGGKGGKGGDSGVPGGVYGCSNAPVTAGSAGGGHVTSHVGGNGGGVFRAEVARTLTLRGAISANGQRGKGSGASGGGAGGSVYLRVRRFVGEAPGGLQANGGAGGSSSGGGGGGGRIAVWRQWPRTEPSISATADGGVGTVAGVTTDNGDPGSVVWGLLPADGTLFLLR